MNNRVMVVDDEPHIRSGVAELLESEGFEVSIASSGRECLETLKNGFRGLILLDVMMPEMDGWGTIQEMINAELVEGNIICLLTALDTPTQAMEGLKEYVADYLTKPFDPQQLLDILRGYIVYLA